jgi:hypothetical protein
MKHLVEAQPLGTCRVLIPHLMNHQEWTIVGPFEIRGFFDLSVTYIIPQGITENGDVVPARRVQFYLTLPDTQFEIIELTNRGRRLIQ